MYYHATFAAYLGSILEKGLIPNYHQNWDNSKKGYVYFSKDEEVAVSMCDSVENKYVSDEVYNQGIIVFAIPDKAFDLALFEDDDNISLNFRKELQCFIYPRIIEPKWLSDYKFFYI